MANADANAGGVFRRSTMNRIASADELDHYIKVTNPSAWAIVIAALLLVAGVIVWAVVAVVPVTVNTTGVVLQTEEGTEPYVICWVDKSTADKIKDSGAQARIGDASAKSVELRSAPMSSSEVMKLLGSDFYSSALNLKDWNYLVVIVPTGEPVHSEYTIQTSLGPAHLVPVSIIVSEKRPINIVLGTD